MIIIMMMMMMTTGPFYVFHLISCLVLQASPWDTSLLLKYIEIICKSICQLPSRCKGEPSITRTIRLILKHVVYFWLI